MMGSIIYALVLPVLIYFHNDYEFDTLAMYVVGAELNMEFIERSVFHKWIKKNAVDRIVEEKTVLDL